MTNNINIVQFVILTVVNTYFLYYFLSLDRDGCECSRGWRRSTLTALYVAMLVFGALNLFTDSSLLFGVFYGIVMLYIILASQFVAVIQATRCSCADKLPFKILKILNIIQIVFAVIAATAMTKFLADAVSFLKDSNNKGPKPKLTRK